MHQASAVEGAEPGHSVVLLGELAFFDGASIGEIRLDDLHILLLLEDAVKLENGCLFLAHLLLVLLDDD